MWFGKICHDGVGIGVTWSAYLLLVCLKETHALRETIGLDIGKPMEGPLIEGLISVVYHLWDLTDVINDQTL